MRTQGGISTCTDTFLASCFIYQVIHFNEESSVTVFCFIFWLPCPTHRRQVLGYRKDIIILLISVSLLLDSCYFSNFSTLFLEEYGQRLSNVEMPQWILSLLYSLQYKWNVGRRAERYMFFSPQLQCERAQYPHPKIISDGHVTQGTPWCQFCNLKVEFTQPVHTWNHCQNLSGEEQKCLSSIKKCCQMCLQWAASVFVSSQASSVYKVAFKYC